MTQTIIKTKWKYYYLWDEVCVIDLDKTKENDASQYIFETSLWRIEFAKENMKPKDTSNPPEWCYYNEETDEWYWEYDAVMRYSKENGITIPTKEQLEAVMLIDSKWHEKIWLKKSGYRRSGDLNNRATTGYLWSGSPHDIISAWAFRWGMAKGGFNYYHRRFAFPLRLLVIQ